MKVGTLVGLLLVVLGAAAIVWGGFSYTKRRDVARIGPVQVTTQERQHVPISPIVGGIAVVAGIALIVAVRRAS